MSKKKVVSTYKRAMLTPDNKEVKSEKMYADSWLKLADPICKTLGLRLIGFNPGLLFCYDETSGTVDIPVFVAKRLAKVLLQLERSKK
jgi:hypothetical protein